MQDYEIFRRGKWEGERFDGQPMPGGALFDATNGRLFSTHFWRRKGDDKQNWMTCGYKGLKRRKHDYIVAGPFTHAERDLAKKMLAGMKGCKLERMQKGTYIVRDYHANV